MKKTFPFTLIVLTCLSLSSCSVIEGIFKAGVWSGILIVVVVVALVIWLLAKLFGGGSKN
ncbi:hypothetical protein LZQ00_14620 [Sphingobacterium sp. SRCM116780]|uniref:hypothetical protein n=1 Tax=Sphingobacterium sp. SRCM116780 TaxID=2907623 RepID=UPI001F39F6D7|nr:hypothetical protein [Sphingobacterium sp. SRCM116780]UIR55493.1 hypothetical protein LZQ00_14620 [Sphingobacterium sp. SRCM116780]